MKVDLKLPEGCSDIDLMRSRLIRSYFQQQKAVLLAMRPGVTEVRMPSKFDRPPKGNCVWYEIVDATRGSYNPMWSVNYEFVAAMVRNADVNPHTFTNTELETVYVEHGERLTANYRAIAAATVEQLAERLPCLCDSYRLVPVSAVEMVKASCQLSAVYELLWRDCRGLEVPPVLPVLARLEYACCPSVFMSDDMPRGWLGKRRLGKIFEVDNEPMVTAPAVTRLLNN